jgi:hypothetical protein
MAGAASATEAAVPLKAHSAVPARSTFQFENHGSRKEERLAQLLEDSSDYDNIGNEAGDTDDVDAAKPFESDIIRDARADRGEGPLIRQPLLPAKLPAATKRLVGVVPGGLGAGGVKRPLGLHAGSAKTPLDMPRVSVCVFVRM